MKNIFSKRKLSYTKHHQYQLIYRITIISIALHEKIKYRV